MTNSLRTDGNTALVEAQMSYSSNIPMISDVNHLTLQDVLNLLEIEKLPEGFYSPDEIVASTQRIVQEHGVERYWEERKFNLAQIEYLQTM